MEYQIPGGVAALLQPTTADRIIGALEEQRATKTNIGTFREAFLLTLILNHARQSVKLVLERHKIYYGARPDLGVPALITWDDVLDRYMGCRRWMELHQSLLEHYASVEGFAVSAAVSMARSKLAEEKKRAESSIKGEGQAGGTTNGAS